MDQRVNHAYINTGKDISNSQALPLSHLLIQKHTHIHIHKDTHSAMPEWRSMSTKNTNSLHDIARTVKERGEADNCAVLGWRKTTTQARL